MLSRRNIFAALCSAPVALASMIGLRKQPEIPTQIDILKSFDARDWAHHFIQIFPGSTVDEGTMATWFANSLMRGYDEGYQHCERGKRGGYASSIDAAELKCTPDHPCELCRTQIPVGSSIYAHGMVYHRVANTDFPGLDRKSKES